MRGVAKLECRAAGENPKPEIRNRKSESNPNDEIRMSKREILLCLSGFQNVDLGEMVISLPAARMVETGGVSLRKHHWGP